MGSGARCSRPVFRGGVFFSISGRLYCAVIALFTVIFALLAGCGGAGGGGSTGWQANPGVTSVGVACSPASITTAQTSACTVAVDGTGSFSSAVSWAVSPAGIGSIDSSGVFTPSAAGTATVTATSTEDTTKSGNATVAVAAAPVSPTITSVEVACSPTSITTSQTSACTATVNGTGSYSSAVNWAVSPAGIGSVSTAGVFTPNAVGTAEITATSTQDMSKSGAATVAVAIPHGSFPVTAIGDSLTAGGQDGTGISYPGQLSELTGTEVANLGVPGQRSGDIVTRTLNAYAGQTEQTFAASFTIPTSGAVSVTFQDGYNPALLASAEPIVTVVGGVSYSLMCDDSLGLDNSAVCAPSSYPASEVPVPSGNPWLSAETGWPAETLLIWAGRNNFWSCSTDPVSSDNCPVAQDIAAAVAVAQLQNANYLVLGIINAEGEPSGSTNYKLITGINSYLSSLYPGHFVDVRSYLVSKYDPSNDADVIDHANDVPPYSLRARNYAGTLASAVTSTAQTAIQLSNLVDEDCILAVGTELMYVTAGGTTATVIRGYAGTTPSTYPRGTAVTAVDDLHLGQNASSPANPSFTNGYAAVAYDVYQWLEQQSTGK
jgi:hypothetical protein